MSKHEIKLPFGGGVAFDPSGNAARHQKIVDARAAFVVQYCESKGWQPDPEHLEISQIMEIREQDGWKNAGKS